MDLVLNPIRDDLLAGRIGVIGVAGKVSVPVLVRLREKLRRRPASATALIDLSDMPEIGAPSSSAVERFVLSTLLRVNIDRRPPFDSLLCTWGSFNGIRPRSSAIVDTSIGGGRALRLAVKVCWSASSFPWVLQSPPGSSLLILAMALMTSTPSGVTSDDPERGGSSCMTGVVLRCGLVFRIIKNMQCFERRGEAFQGGGSVAM